MQLINWKWKGEIIIAIFAEEKQVSQSVPAHKIYWQWESGSNIGELIEKHLADERAELSVEQRIRARKLDIDQWLEQRAELELEYFTEDCGEMTELHFGPALMMTAEERSDIATLLRPASEDGDVTGIIRNWNEMRQTLSKKLCYER